MSSGSEPQPSRTSSDPGVRSCCTDARTGQPVSRRLCSQLQVWNELNPAEVTEARHQVGVGRVRENDMKGGSGGRLRSTVFFLV